MDQRKKGRVAAGRQAGRQQRHAFLSPLFSRLVGHCTGQDARCASYDGNEHKGHENAEPDGSDASGNDCTTRAVHESAAAHGMLHQEEGSVVEGARTISSQAGRPGSLE